MAEAYGLLRNFANVDCQMEGNIEGSRILQKLDTIAGYISISQCREYEIAQCRKDQDYLVRRLHSEKREEQAFLENGNVENLPWNWYATRNLLEIMWQRLLIV